MKLKVVFSSSLEIYLCSNIYTFYYQNSGSAKRGGSAVKIFKISLVALDPLFKLKNACDAEAEFRVGQLLHRSYGKASSVIWPGTLLIRLQHSDGTQGTNYSVNTQRRKHTALVGVYFNMQRQHVVPSKTAKFILCESPANLPFSTKNCCFHLCQRRHVANAEN